MNLSKLTAVFLLILPIQLFAQKSIKGRINDAETKEPLGYVSLGIKGKDVGTVSNMDGTFDLRIDPEFQNDSITFSCIGYFPQSFHLKDYDGDESKEIKLERKDISLNEVVVAPFIYERKVLGNRYQKRKRRQTISIDTVKAENRSVFELGVLLKIKKRAILDTLICNISYSKRERLNFRLNVYRKTGKMSFENVLDEQIFVKQSINKEQNEFFVDLTPYNLMVEGNTLVTLETLEKTEDTDNRMLFISGGLFGSSSYVRKTSLGAWSKPVTKIGIAVIAKVEK